ncbi:MAG: hypothetical protein JNL28_00170 [Planctomycetes bacterium]|nr:hypothetical protein [Planctomycetota bacterium]
MKLIALALCLAAGSAVIDDKPPTPKAPAPLVTGKVLFDGKRPEPTKLPATPEQAKGCCPEGQSVDATDPRLVIDDKNGIANVLVTIQVDAVKAVPSKTAIVVDQKSCVFEPHCTIVPAGSKVVFKNSDTVNHNVHIYARRNDSSNDTMAPGTQKEYVFENTDKITVGCDYHPWMSSLLLVVDTPYAALTKSDGSFKIEGLKPGTYKVKLWHETLGRAEAEAVIQADGTSAPLTVKLSEPKKKD